MWEKIKIWWNTKALPWLKKLGLRLLTWFKKHWMVIVNFIVIFLAYNNVYDKPGVVFAEVLLGLWLFVCGAYALYKLFSKQQ